MMHTLQYHHLSEVGSTNSVMLAQIANLPNGTVFYATAQKAGRGQKGNSWESEPGKNLTFSLLLKQPQIEAIRQFYISEAASLAVAEALACYANDIYIKWPNDIYYRDQKICGMLIENSLMGAGIAYSVAGIGVNVNQERFLSDAPNPVSLKNITGRDHNLEELLHDICERLMALADFAHFSEADLQALHARYLARLYRGDGKPHQWQLPDGTLLMATITGVQPDGMLCLRHETTGEVHKYYFKEVKHVINKNVL